MQYFPLFAGNDNGGTLIVRSNHDVEQLALPVQRVIQSMDRDLPVADVLTMNQLLGKSTLDQSFNATLITGFADSLSCSPERVYSGCCPTSWLSVQA